MDIRYVAGFFDGEGSVYIGKTKPNSKTRSPRYTLQIMITNSDKAILEKIHEFFGVGCVVLTNAHRKLWGRK